MKREDLILTNEARVASIDLEVGEASPLHYHSKVTENVICLKGTITLQYGIKNTAIKLHPGDRVTIEPMEEHHLINHGDVLASYLLVQSGNYDFVPKNS